MIVECVILCVLPPSELVKCPPGLVAPKATLTCNKTGKKESCSLTCASKAHYLAGRPPAVGPKRGNPQSLQMSPVCSESDNSYSVSCGIPILRGKSPARLNSSTSQGCIGLLPSRFPVAAKAASVSGDGQAKRFHPLCCVCL